MYTFWNIVRTKPINNHKTRWKSCLAVWYISLSLLRYKMSFSFQSWKIKAPFQDTYPDSGWCHNSNLPTLVCTLAVVVHSRIWVRVFVVIFPSWFRLPVDKKSGLLTEERHDRNSRGPNFSSRGAAQSSSLSIVKGLLLSKETNISVGVNWCHIQNRCLLPE